MHRHRILVVEDEPELAELLGELLVDLSFEVECAGNMEEALAALERREPCAIISDLTLPDVDREDVVGTLRSRSGSASIILMSAIAAQDLARLGKQQGVDQVIPKPFDLDQFERALVFGCGRSAEAPGDED